MKVKIIILLMGLIALFTLASSAYLYRTAVEKNAAYVLEEEFMRHAEMAASVVSKYFAAHQAAVQTLAGLTELSRVLEDPRPESTAKVNQILDRYQHALRADICYLMDQSGTVVASSNRNASFSLVGNNYAFRPYFDQALKGTAAVYLAAFGITSKTRGVYFSYPIHSTGQEKPLGVAVIKADIESLESTITPGHQESWALTNSDGLIFASNHKEWRLQLMWQLTPEIQSDLTSSRQFGPGPWNWIGFVKTAENRVRDRQGHSYMAHSEPLQIFPGWQVVHFVKEDILSSQLQMYTDKDFEPLIIILALVVGLTIFVIYFLADRELKNRRRMESELKKQRNLAQKYLDTADVIMVALDRQQKVSMINQKGARVLEMAAEDIIGQNWFDTFVPARLKDQVKTVYQRLMAGAIEPVQYHENPILTAGGQERMILWHNSILKDEAGKITGTLGSGIDVTEQRQQEQALADRESQYRLLVANIPCVVYKGYADWSIDFFDDKIEDLTEYPKEWFESRKLNWMDVIDPEDLGEAKAAFIEALKTDRSYVREYRIKTRSGKAMWVEERGQIVCDPEGRIEYISGVFFDINAQKQTELALMESEEKYRSMMTALNDPVYICSPDYRIEYMNPAMTEKIGYDAVGRSCHQTLYKQETVCPWCVYDTVRTNRTMHTEIENPFNDDGFYTVSHSPVHHVDGSISKMTVYRDISDRKQAEEKIKEYSEKLEELVQQRTQDLEQSLAAEKDARSQIDGILASLAGGLIAVDKKQRVILINATAQNLLNLQIGDIIEPFDDHMMGDQTLFACINATYDRGRNGCRFEFEHFAEGARRPSVFRVRSGLILDPQNEPSGVVLALDDVTYEREIDRMKSELIATAAHELRTPLTSIRGYSEILLTMENLKTEEQKRFLDHINNESIQMVGIIDDMLHIAQIESGRGLTLNKTVCELNDLIQCAVIPFQERYRAHGFEVITLPQKQNVSVDKEKIGQVLSKLIENAVKFSPNGGAISIAVQADKERLLFSIQDQGIGMPEDMLQKVFDKFYRVDASDTAQEGTGLGLTIVKYFVEAHGGEVWLESEHGQGTTAKFTIPVEN